MVIEFDKLEELKLAIGLVMLHGIVINPKAHGVDFIEDGVHGAMEKAEQYSAHIVEYMKEKYSRELSF